MGLINAEKLLKTLKQRRDYIRYSAKPTEAFIPVYRGRLFELENAVLIVEDLAERPVDPVRHGHWIDAVFVALDVDSADYQRAIQDYCKHGGNAAEWQPDTQYCSDCLAGFNVIDNDFILSADYCPHCGAKMDETEVDDEAD